MPGSNSDAAGWRTTLAEIVDEIKSIVGSRNIDVPGAFSVDEQATLKMLHEQKAEVEQMLERLGAGDTSTRNARFTEAAGGDYY